ncbi:ATP-binding protein [Actinoplanes subtropicus]|uniref:ATP-binding protein n=1 Tax=Actinoplanes subtropicus TaxID=543632 RepID=UPI000A06021F|nr:NB-ARC domain-containing protein [Actinoplanes subtropicus]
MASSEIGNLPTELTSFVGRRHDVAEVKRLLPAARLVTVTGVGGVGKTRLALRVARQLHRSFPGGVWLVQLDRLRDQSLLALTVAGTLGLVEQPGRAAAEVLAEYLRGRRVLLLLDNCEHLVDAVAKLADRLLSSAAGLRVLATSREPLGIGAETVVELPPLPTPDPSRPVDRAELLRSDAVALFTERAATLLPGFEVTEVNQAAVVEICHLVEGLPLAVELAATWLRVLSPGQIRDRLTDRLALLTRGSRLVPDRQQTLRGCIDWSYELCTRAERRLWARLSVFAGGFDIESVARVCDGGETAPDYLGDVLESLRHKSVLLGDESAGRYRMLETLREYGGRRLAEEPDHGLIARRHRDHYAAMAARAEAAWTGPEQLSWARTLTREHANLQLAMEYCLREPDQAGAAQDLAARLWFFWIACGFLREGRYYLDRAVALGGVGRARRWALWACAFVAGSMNDLGIAETLARQCHAEAVEAGDRRLTICATEVRGMIHAIRGDLDPAIDLLRECEDYYGGLDRIDVGRLRTLPMLGVTLVMRGDLDAALGSRRSAGGCARASASSGNDRTCTTSWAWPCAASTIRPARCGT